MAQLAFAKPVAHVERLTGRFRHGRGDSYSERTRDDGSVLLARYSFNDITPFRWSPSEGGLTYRVGRDEDEELGRFERP